MNENRNALLEYSYLVIRHLLNFKKLLKGTRKNLKKSDQTSLFYCKNNTGISKIGFFPDVLKY